MPSPFFLINKQSTTTTHIYLVFLTVKIRVWKEAKTWPIVLFLFNIWISRVSNAVLTRLETQEDGFIRLIDWYIWFDWFIRFNSIQFRRRTCKCDWILKSASNMQYYYHWLCPFSRLPRRPANTESFGKVGAGNEFLSNRGWSILCWKSCALARIFVY
jgi:hypothetical protein